MQDQKMYVVTRADLSPGLATAQAVHAAFGFALKHPELSRDWMADSQYLVIVSVKDEQALVDLCLAANGQQLHTYLWSEPDLGDQATALALGPCEASRRLTANLGLHGRTRVPV